MMAGLARGQLDEVEAELVARAVAGYFKAREALQAACRLAGRIQNAAEDAGGDDEEARNVEALCTEAREFFR
jgi:hypothetical protein